MSERPKPTRGDALDRLLGGPEHYVSDHCQNDRHRVCLGYYGGRTCECECGYTAVPEYRKGS